jgi:hypothetical protein
VERGVVVDDFLVMHELGDAEEDEAREEGQEVGRGELGLVPEVHMYQGQGNVGHKKKPTGRQHGSVSPT